MRLPYKKTEDSPRISSPPEILTRDEMNLVEFPFCLPSHRHPAGKDSIHLKFAGQDSEGNPIEREWLVTGGKYGLPLAIDEEVLLGLFHLWQRDKFRERHVWFTQYSLFRLLGWDPNTKSYARLENSMDRLLGLRIKSHQTFWNNQERCHVTDGFGLVDSYRLWRKDSESKDHPFLSRVTFSELLHTSFTAGYIKTLDLNFYLALRYPLARKLYRLIDKRSHKRPLVEIGLMDLAQRLALTDSAYPSKVRQHLKAPHHELIESGFLQSAQYVDKNGTPWVRYVVIPKNRRRIAPPPPKDASLPFPDHPLTKELVARGITHAVAAVLVDQHDEKTIAEQIEAFDFLVKQKSPQLAKNPAGYLRRAIETNFALPPGYVSKSERDRKRQEREAAARRKAEVAAADERAAEKGMARFEAFWQSLEVGVRREIEAATLSALSPSTRANLEAERAEGVQGIAHAIYMGQRNALLAHHFPDRVSITWLHAS